VILHAHHGIYIITLLTFVAERGEGFEIDTAGSRDSSAVVGLA
jgi:hypothetical protein